MQSKTFEIPILDIPRVRFNNGYWDGAIFATRGLPENQVASVVPYDAFYEAGIVAGLSFVKGEKADGKKAWAAFLCDLTDPDMLFQVGANP